MGDIIKRIRKIAREEMSPLDKVLGKGDEVPVEEERDEMEVTHYGRTVAGPESSEEPKKGGFQEADLEGQPKELGILKSKAFREISMEDLDKDPEPSAELAAGEENPQVDQDPVIRLTTRDRGRIKHLRLICHLIEEGFYAQAIDAVRELQNLS